MQKINLTAANPTEQRILDYLTLNASEHLAGKINTGKKTLGGALEYAKKEAQKLANGQGCICIDDQTVFGWIVHFFEEDFVEEPKAKKQSRTPSGPVPKAQQPAPKAQSQAPKAQQPAPIFLELFTPEQLGVSK